MTEKNKEELSDFLRDVEALSEKGLPRDLQILPLAVVALDNAPEGIKLDGAYALVAAYVQNLIENDKYRLSEGAKEILGTYVDALKEKSDYLRK